MSTYTTLLTGILEETLFASLYCLCSFAQGQLIIFMWVHFWVLNLFHYSICPSFTIATLS